MRSWTTLFSYNEYCTVKMEEHSMPNDRDEESHDECDVLIGQSAEHASMQKNYMGVRELLLLALVSCVLVVTFHFTKSNLHAEVVDLSVEDQTALYHLDRPIKQFGVSNQFGKIQRTACP